MAYQAVIFDLYGTLVDFLPDEEYRTVHVELAGVFGIPTEEFRRLWYASMLDRDTGVFGDEEGYFRFICREFGREPLPEQLERAVNLRLALIRRNLVPRAGAQETFAALEARGIRRGLISDCAPAVPRVWPETALAACIDAAIFSCAAGMRKPDPRIYRQVCDRLGVEPRQCLYVGDGGSHELTGARRAGMTPVLIRVDDDDYDKALRPDAQEWEGPVIAHLPAILGYL